MTDDDLTFKEELATQMALASNVNPEYVASFMAYATAIERFLLAASPEDLRKWLPQLQKASE